MSKYEVIQKIMQTTKINEKDKVYYIEMFLKGWCTENDIKWIIENNIEEMKKTVYTKESLLNIMGSYLRQISKDNGEHPKAVLNDIKVSMQYILKVNEYNGKYKDELNK